MSSDTKRLSLLRGFRMLAKGLRLWGSMLPKYLLATGTDGFIGAISPYVAVWFSARLLDEIGGARCEQVILRLAAGAAVCASLLALIRLWANCHGKSYREMLRHKEEWLFGQKQLHMDFATIEDPDTVNAYSHIMEMRSIGDLGLRNCIIQMQNLWKWGLTALCSGIMCIGLFTHRIPAGSILPWLDHPLAYLGLVLCLVFAILLAPVFTRREAAVWDELDGRFVLINRRWDFYSSIGESPEWHMDLRSYPLTDLCKKELAAISELHSFRGPLTPFYFKKLGVYNALSGAVGAGVTLAAYLFICLRAWAGAFGVGSIAQYVSAVTGLCAGISGVLRILESIRSNAPYLEKVFQWLDTPDEMYKGSLSVEKRADRNYEVEFRHVSFRYPGSEVWALRDVSFRFCIGQRLAVVGPNGSGKTTMIKLLCRLYDPTEGEILLNGIDIRKYDPKQYMDIFSVVFQDFRLLALPLGQNVAGSTEYDAARAADCLQKAGLGGWLEKLPQGLDTCLYREFDEQGVDISGGEAQKIAIARALYKNAPFIILDEPTAALDPIAEAQVYAGFDTLIGDRTAVYISHRLSSCKFCDAIAVFDSGRIVQFGTHSELVDAPGRYAELWAAQAKYYI